MEILNPSPVLCLPQAMWLTYRAIMEAPGLSHEQVFSLVVPENLRSRTPQDGAHGRRALAGLRELGLVEQDETGLLTADRLAGAADFLRVLRHRIVCPPESLRANISGAPDLRAGLVWLMRQSPFEALHYETVQTAMPTGLFTNDTRWNGFRWWSQALGFSQPALSALSKAPDQKAKIVPDPTEAVLGAIRKPFGAPLPRNEKLPIQRLLVFLREELPVLPGHPSATYDGLEDFDDHGVRVLGLALSSAEQRGVLTMAYQSDPSGVIALPDAQEYGRNRYVSNVTINAEAA